MNGVRDIFVWFFLLMDKQSSVSGGILRWQILIQRAAQGYIHHLNPTAYAKHRQLSLNGHGQNGQFELVTNRRCFTKLCDGGFMKMDWLHITAPCQQQAIQLVQTFCHCI